MFCSFYLRTGTDAGQSDGTTVHSGDQDDKLFRAVRGVMRVGRLATGIFLQGDYEVDLVVLSKDKPTWSLLERIASVFTDQLVVGLFTSNLTTASEISTSFCWSTV